MANFTFTPGDLVISVYGDGAPNDTTNYTDNQASPITLEEITTSGAFVDDLVLPQTVPVGSLENAVSGEYGSSSEGTLELSGDGQSLTIAGYGINAATYNSAEATTEQIGPKAAGGLYGDDALAQTYSVPTGQTNGAPSGVDTVSRVVADIRYDGTIDTSTSLLDIDNTNNPRSVFTVDGSSFYIAGQGVKGDTTQGLFYAKDGATGAAATAIDTATDNRTVEMFGGNLYVSTDSKQGANGNNTDNISEYSGDPTSAATPTILSGISQTITLTAATENGVDNARLGTTVYLSPENYFFANATTLYVADGGQPKGGSSGKAGLGDGGLQKWTLNTSTGAWTLNYTLSAGLNLVANTATSGTTGLIGLTGSVDTTTGIVTLYATNSTIGDLDQTYLYGIADTLSATTQPTGESFTQLMQAAPDTNIRGVAFAPQPASVCYCSGVRIRTMRAGSVVDVAVEDLAIGDLVVVASGERRPIRWIGHRTLDARRHPRPREVMPVRIAAHALGENKPSRDLWVSPGHAICLDLLGEVLITASSVINGSSIRQMDVDTVTYWHVELDSHDLLLAENLAAESYIDCNNRGFFVEGGVVTLDASPDADCDRNYHLSYCRPFHTDGPFVEVARSQIDRRAVASGWLLETRDPLADLHLVADGVRIDPEVDGLTVRFAMPAGAREVFLASETSRPVDVGAGPDFRHLGVCLVGLFIEDSAGRICRIALDDSRIGGGFHEIEGGAEVWRWTTGRARLPSALWAGIANFSLRIVLSGPALPRWAPPPSVANRSDVEDSAHSVQASTA